MRGICTVVASVGVALALCLVPTGSASAFGGEQLYCSVGNGPLADGACNQVTPTSPTGVAYHVVDQSGSGYSYSWTLSGNYSTLQGCTSTTDYCYVTTPNVSDHEIIATVVVTQNGSSETLSATAEIASVCGGVFC